MSNYISTFGNNLFTITSLFAIFYGICWAAKEISQRNKRIAWCWIGLWFAVGVRTAYWSVATILADPGKTHNATMFEYKWIVAATTACIAVVSMIEYVHSIRPFNREHHVLLYIGIFSLSALLGTLTK